MTYNHYAYGEILAQSLRPIAHGYERKSYFTAYGLEDLPEMGEQLSNLDGTILIAVDGKESSYGNNGADGYTAQPHYAFIVAQTTLSDDKATIRKATDDCEAIAREIAKRLIRDAQRYDRWRLGDELKLNGIGPIGDNFYGVVLSFSMQEHLNTTLNAKIWK